MGRFRFLRRPIRKSRGATGPSLDVPETIAGLVFWERADVFTPSSWVDRIASISAAQGTPANQPSATTRIEFGGQDVIDFDGSDFMATGDDLKGGTGVGECTVVAVFRPTGNGQGAMALTNASGGVNSGCAIFYDGGNVTLRRFSGGGDCTATVPSGLAYACILSATTAQGRGFVNSNSPIVNSTTITSWYNRGRVQIGDIGTAVYRLNGQVAEVMVYDNAISDASAAILNAYFADRYGITIS